MRTLLRVAPIALMVSLVVPALTPSVVSASPVDQQRSEVERIVDELERLEEKALQIGEDYVEAVDTKAQLDQDIIELEADIAGKEAEVATLRADLGDMAVRAFVGAGTTPLGPLFENTDDINDVLQRDELARVALSTGDVTTDELDALVAGLEQDRKDLGDKREEAQDLADELIDAQTETERLTGEYTQARVDAEAQLGQLIADEEARRAAESLARIQAEIEATQNQAPQQTGNSGNNGSGNTNSGNTNSGNGGGNTDSGSGDTNAGNTDDNGDDGGSENTGGATTSPAPTPAPAAPEPVAPPPSSRAGVAVNAALSQQGVPYRYATESPGVSFDCSGLTKYAWGAAGVYLPHQSRAQYASIPHVSKGAAQPGDLLFYYSPISHVGVYLGGGQLVHAPNTGSVVKIASVNWGKVSGVGRPG